MDNSPYTMDEKQKHALGILARQVVEKINQNTKGEEISNIQARIFQNSILESERFFVMTADTKGIIKTFNKGAEKILGYSAAEIVDKVNIGLFIGEEGIKAKAEALSKEFNCKIEEDGFAVAVERARRGLIDEN